MEKVIFKLRLEGWERGRRLEETKTGEEHSGIETGLHKGIKIRNFRLLML